MAKGKTQKQDRKLTPTQRQARTYQILFAAVAVIVLISMVLSLVVK